VPLIVVGNVVAGGAGKTPVTLALAKLLQTQGKRVHLIARGHGGKVKGPLRVDLDKHNALDVGDEPLLLAQTAPTFIGTDRGATAQLAATDCDVIISDDGLQSPRLKPDLALLVMDGVMGIGNGKIIPAGPLREPLAQALAKVAAVVQVGGSARDYTGKPVWLGDFVAQNNDWLRGARVLAFAGLGQPEKFFATLTTSGAHLTAALPFADHHPYTENEIRRLIAQADASEAILVTTAKDAVRLPWNLREQVRVVAGEFIWRDVTPVQAALQRLWTQP
jgi:tetraacyldisaccharide 4'-kinase